MMGLLRNQQKENRLLNELWATTHSPYKASTRESIFTKPFNAFLIREITMAIQLETY